MRPTILALFGLTVLSACSGKDEDDTGGGTDDTSDTSDTSDTGDTTADNARVRVLHLSPDAPAVDVFVDGVTDPVVTGLEFPDGTAYLDVPAGTYTFKVAPAGAGVDAAVLTVADLALAEGQGYTAVAFDVLESIQAAAFVEDTTGLPDGQIRVNVMHAAPMVGEVDIWVLGETPTPLLVDVPFGANAVLDLPVGSYPVGFDVDNDEVPDVTFTIPELPGGARYNLFATNDMGGNVFLLGQFPDGVTVRIDPDPAPPPPSFVRVLHLSPDAPAVDVWVDGFDAPVATDVAFGEGTSYLEVPEGTYTFRVAPTGTSPEAAVLVIEGLSLAGGQWYTAAAIDELSDIRALALVDDAAGIPDGSYRAQVVHAAAAVGQVDIWEVSGSPTPLLTDVDFAASAVLDLPESPYTLGFDVDDDAVPDVTFGIPTLAAGQLVNVFATSDATGSVHLLAQLEDGSLVRIDPS